MSDYLDQIVAFICKFGINEIPPDVIQRAKLVIADSLAVIARGAKEGEVKTLTQRLAVPNGRKTSSLIGGGLRTEPSKAALINGTAGTFLDLDEGHRFARGHPAMHVIPAALAVAEKEGLSGKDFLCAFILGYEVGARIGIASNLPPAMQSHGTWGTMGASVAVAKLMNCAAQDMREIINVSSSLSLTTSRQAALEGATVRNVYTGVSGYMGILTLELVQSGFVGERDGLRSVFGKVLSDRFSPEPIIDGLGQRFEIMRNYFKLHACCRYNHGTLDALSSIIAKRPEIRNLPHEIEEVEVTTYSFAAQLSNKNPRTSLAAKFSIPFAVASFIIHGSAGTDSFSYRAVNDPLIKVLSGRVHVKEDPEFSAMLPNCRPSRVRVTLTNGMVFEAQVLTNKGDAEDPYNTEELRLKYFELIKGVWDRKIGETMYKAIMNLDGLENINLMTKQIGGIS
jgi:2-methylcitrate dehydratase PrpD